MVAAAIPAGRPSIDFRTHRLRHGEGAPYDFEKMIALLVQATQGEAHLAFTRQGDWGIDVLKGDLDGVVTVWQAKYYADGVKPDGFTRIKESLASALKAAREHGHTIDRWVLCLPTSFTPHHFKRWQEEVVPMGAAAGVEVLLWDETQLRELLHLSESAHIRDAFYNPYRPPPVRADAPGLRVQPSPAQAAWEGGSEINLCGGAYLLHDPVSRHAAPDRSWELMTATAAGLDTATVFVRLHGLRTRRDTASADHMRRELLACAELLSEIDGRHAVPKLVGVHELDDLLVLLSAQPPGHMWGQVFAAPLDPLVIPVALEVMSAACTAVAELHRHGHAHGDLGAESIVVSHDQRTGRLRDIGLARLTGEALPPADVYQLAALLYRTCTGHAPMTGEPMPVSVTVAPFPTALDSLLARCLDADPQRRPSMREFGAGLRDGRRAFFTKAAP